MMVQECQIVDDHRHVLQVEDQEAVVEHFQSALADPCVRLCFDDTSMLVWNAFWRSLDTTLSMPLPFQHKLRVLATICHMARSQQVDTYVMGRTCLPKQAQDTELVRKSTRDHPILLFEISLFHPLSYAFPSSIVVPKIEPLFPDLGNPLGSQSMRVVVVHRMQPSLDRRRSLSSHPK